ncbi:MAG: hypothetical protein IJK28_02370 [Clostridia bacterium]|nr:hypothetical protein [Clostridia bacterium]
MRRLFALSLVLCMALTAVFAETRERVIYLEGQEELINETLYAGPGFSFWYDSDWLEVDAGMSESGQSLILRPIGFGDDLPIYVEMLSPAAAGTGAWEFISSHAADDTVVLFENLESGAEMAWFDLAEAGNPGLVHGYYLVTMDMDEEDENAPWMAAVSTFPVEAWEGAGRRFAELMRTVFFGDAPQAAAQAGMPVRAEWAEGRMNTDTAYLSWNLAGSDAWVLFTAEEGVTDFRILELTMQFTGGGDYAFHEDEAFRLDGLWPVQPLIAGLDFPGDMPCWGIAYVDAAGAQHRCTVEISGENGEIILNPY